MTTTKATKPEQAKRQGGRPALERSHYAKVAEVYTEALRAGANPTQAVVDHFTVNKSTAAKWIYRCRREPYEFLPMTSRGRSAAAPTPEVTSR